MILPNECIIFELEGPYTFYGRAFCGMPLTYCHGLYFFIEKYQEMCRILDLASNALWQRPHAYNRYFGHLLPFVLFIPQSRFCVWGLEEDIDNALLLWSKPLEPSLPLRPVHKITFPNGGRGKVYFQGSAVVFYHFSPRKPIM